LQLAPFVVRQALAELAAVGLIAADSDCDPPREVWRLTLPRPADAWAKRVSTEVRLGFAPNLA
jgi:hypothetical protein